MISTVALVFFGLAIGGLAVVLRVRGRALQLAREREQADDPYEALSLFWAWGSNADVSRMVLRVEPGQRLRSRRLDPWLLLTFPANAVGILAIVLYQTVRQSNGRRVCLFWPNCSAYGLGVMRRRNVFEATRLVLARVRSCNGATQGLEIAGWR